MRLLQTVPAMLLPSLQHRTMVHLHGANFVFSTTSSRASRGANHASLTNVQGLEPPPNPTDLLTEDQLEEKVDMVSCNDRRIIVRHLPVLALNTFLSA